MVFPNFFYRCLSLFPTLHACLVLLLVHVYEQDPSSAAAYSSNLFFSHLMIGSVLMYGSCRHFNTNHNPILMKCACGKCVCVCGGKYSHHTCYLKPTIFGKTRQRQEKKKALSTCLLGLDVSDLLPPIPG